MKCVLCGQESPKPVCKVCTREIAMETPFLTRRGFACGDFENVGFSGPILFPGDFARANDMAHRAMLGEKVDYIVLARLALRCHGDCREFLGIFDIEENYYLRLAEQFAEKSDTPDGKYILARVYAESGNMDEAISIMDGIWRDGRDYSLFYAELLVRAGKWGRAVEIYNHILSGEPNNAEVWLLLADALFTAERYEEADRAYLRVLQINRDNAEAWFRRGLCLRKMGKWGGALQSFQTAVRKNPKFREAYEEMLDILLERNMFARAKETLNAMKEEGFDVNERLNELEGLMRE